MAKPLGGHLQNLAFLSLASRAGQGCRAGQHRHVAGKIARAAGGEDLLLPVARFEHLDLSAQDNCQREIALAGFEYDFAAAHDARLAERLQHRQLAVIQLRKGDAFRIAVELLVVIEFVHTQVIALRMKSRFFPILITKKREAGCLAFFLSK